MGSPEPSKPPGIRISDADRERAAQRLHKALSEGRITLAELEERLEAVYAARYEADLVPPLADLPVEDTVVAPYSSVPVTPAGPPVVLRSGMSTIKRTGRWQVPARLRVQSGMGSAVLDFSEAVIGHPVVEIELALGAGSARILVPEGATADVTGVVATMGSVTSKVSEIRTPDSGPHFVVHGTLGMGSLKVRRPYRFGNKRF
ncbi:protein of unknown function [Pseudonocardia thermophila]|uniref:DUF1707 domain-containing protein n=1 Tax=Pseudonocardia thermophila TaxID=1848 RepID=A0A1M6SP59_PSETH|nr:DUF1707 domain-containing protein [Pseudonocardia thermophila]SHK46419.1 protein of unknown function [Pseudonocardia thermophila]